MLFFFMINHTRSLRPITIKFIHVERSSTRQRKDIDDIIIYRVFFMLVSISKE